MAKKVLLIEDDFFIRELYKKQLEQMGYITESCEDGISGLEAIKKGVHDLILLDIMLPGVDGIAILRDIKGNPETAHNRIVLLTNMGQEDIIKEAFKIGAEGYLIKSTLTPKEVVREVQTFLDKPTPATAATPNPA